MLCIQLLMSQLAIALSYTKWEGYNGTFVGTQDQLQNASAHSTLRIYILVIVVGSLS